MGNHASRRSIEKSMLQILTNLINAFPPLTKVRGIHAKDI